MNVRQTFTLPRGSGADGPTEVVIKTVKDGEGTEGCDDWPYGEVARHPAVRLTARRVHRRPNDWGGNPYGHLRYCR